MGINEEYLRESKNYFEEREMKYMYKSAFMEYMDNNEIKYQEIDDFRLSVIYAGENMKSIKVYFFFDKDGDNMVQLSCMQIAGFKNSMEVGVNACNAVNTKYRWVKFYIDDDGDLMCDIDAYLDENSCGEVCMQLLSRMVNIVDETYPAFMRALWAN